MLTACEIASMRECVESALPETVEILTAARSAQPAGGWKDDWDNATSSTVFGLVLPDTEPGDHTEGGKQVSELRWIVRLPSGTTVTTQQRLRVNGVTYQILAVPPPRAWSVGVDCRCRTL
jgi:hypothetical protein